jgi:GxxExxY protein
MSEYQEQKNFLTILKVICDKIMLQHGPFLKEGIYQEILFHELNELQLQPLREVVFGSYFIDSKGSKIYIGSGHSLRTDIELPKKKCILELKSSGNDTKDENIWQLRNYLEQREDMKYGIVINFVSKFGKREGNNPFVQYDLLVKTDKFMTERGININQYYHHGPIHSIPYPEKEQIFLRDLEIIMEEID